MGIGRASRGWFDGRPNLDAVTETHAPRNDTSLAAIVPCRDATSTLAVCLAALRAELPPRARIIVVDDRSRDGSAELAADYADIVVDSLDGTGAGAARNAGAALVGEALLLFVDADVVVRPGAIAALVAATDAGWDASFGAYAPLPPRPYRNGPTLFKTLQQHWVHTRAAGSVCSFWSGLGIVRREAFMAVGGFDPRATAGADVEDIDLGYRLHSAGFRICQEPTALATHHKRYGLLDMIRSDVLHRAVPWVRTMARTRHAHAELNLAPSALASAASLSAALVAGAMIAVSGASAGRLAAAAAGLAGWLAGHLRFFRFSLRAAGPRGAIVVPLQLLYGLYAPLGAAIGVLAAIVDRSQAPRRARTARGAG